jgi:hypothetical protein
MPEEEKNTPTPETPSPIEIEVKDSTKITTADDADPIRKAKAKARRQDPFDGTKRGM